MIFFISSLLFGCINNGDITTLYGRGGSPLYHALIPSHWEVKEINGPLEDTKTPIAEYTFNGITVAIHNFPAISLEKRIPPEAQIARWERLHGKGHVNLEHVGGFVGLSYASDNVMAWALQIAPVYFHSLATLFMNQEIRSDITIKATGPEETLIRYENEIRDFVHSLHLIQEIPPRL